MPALAASVRRAAADSTLEFDWLLGEAQWFSLRRVAALTGMSESFLEKLWDDAEHPLHLAGHAYCAGAQQARQTKRIPRAFVVRLLVTSATYDADEKLRAYLSCLREFSRTELHAIAGEALRLAATK